MACAWVQVAVGDRALSELPETKAGQTAIVVFWDQLSKIVRFAPCWNKMAAEGVAQIFERDSGCTGSPSSWCLTEISFSPLSSLLKSVTCLALISVRPLHCTYIQTDRQTERANQALEDILRHVLTLPRIPEPL